MSEEPIVNCHTCAHSYGDRPEFLKCGRSNIYVSVHRQFASLYRHDCDEMLSGWMPKPPEPPKPRPRSLCQWLYDVLFRMDQESVDFTIKGGGK